MQTLTPDENLVAQVARATCFTYRLDSAGVPEDDVVRYVDELIALVRLKPDALLIQSSDEQPMTVTAAVRFCAEQLAAVAPQHAARLRKALENAP